MTDAPLSPAPPTATAPVADTPAPSLIAGAVAPPTPAADPPAPTGAAAAYPDPKTETPPPADPPADGDPPSEAPPILTTESYKDLKFRDGMSPTESTLKSFTELAAKAGLSPENAQTLVDLQQDIATEQGTAFRDAQLAEAAKIHAEWRTEAEALPFMKENGENVLSSIGVLFDEFDSSKTFRTMLDQTGMGNHPATLQFLHDIVQVLVEGKSTTPGRAIASGPKGRAPSATPAEIMYPNTPPN